MSPSSSSQLPRLCKAVCSPHPHQRLPSLGTRAMWLGLQRLVRHCWRCRLRFSPTSGSCCAARQDLWASALERPSAGRRFPPALQAARPLARCGVVKTTASAILRVPFLVAWLLRPPLQRRPARFSHSWRSLGSSTASRRLQARRRRHLTTRRSRGAADRSRISERKLSKRPKKIIDAVGRATRRGSRRSHRDT